MSFNGSNQLQQFNLSTSLRIIAVAGIMLLSSSAFAEEKVTLSLEDCIKIALEKSPALMVAREKTIESAAKVKETRTGFLPKVSALGTATKLDEAPYMDMSKLTEILGPIMEALNPGSTTNSNQSSKITMGSDMIYSAALTVQQPIFTGFKISNGYKAAQNVYKSSIEDELKSRHDVVLGVKKLFFTNLQVERMVEVCDTSISQLEGIVRDLENMKEQGMVGDPEVMNASIQLHNSELAKIKAQNGVVMAKSTLCNSMGIDWNTGIVLKFDLTEPDKIDITDLPALVAKAQTNQPEVKALEHKKEALKNQVAIYKAGYLPNVVAKGNFNLKNPNREYEEKFYGSWDITLALQMNIIDWGESSHKTSQAASQLRQLEEAMVQLKSGIALTVENNYLAVEEAFKKIGLNKKTMLKAQTSYNITLDKFQVGMVKNSDLLDAQRTLTQAKNDFYNSVIGYYMAHAELEHLIDNK